MVTKLDFRALRADEVQVRFKQFDTKEKQQATKAMYLLYKDARCDMRILDEVFGTFGWSREHKMLDGKLYCSVSIKNPDTGEWVTKDDAGEETQVEATKGEASDAFKRACFNWGIGRELYTGPKKIEIPFESDFEQKNKAHYGLYVSEMVVKDHRIEKLVICDKYKVRYSWTRDGVTASAPKVEQATIRRVGSVEPANPIEKKQFSSKSEAIQTAKITLPRLKTKEDLKKFWDLYPAYHQDIDFKALFTARKNELGVA